MINKTRLTITVDIVELEKFRKIINDNGVKTSFVVNNLIKDFNLMFEVKDEK